MPLVGVLHEALGAEEFREFLKGPLFLDEKKIFYGPKERRLGLIGLFRLEHWLNVKRTSDKGISGNLKGDGTLLGGVFVIGPKEQGLLYEHRERVWGDQCNTTHILEAVSRIKRA